MNEVDLYVFFSFFVVCNEFNMIELIFKKVDYVKF